MGFADYYLDNSALYQPLIENEPETDLEIIICIPAYNEETLTICFKALYDCELPPCKVEIIALINSPKDIPDEVVSRNLACLKEGFQWIENNQREGIRFYVLYVPDLPPKHAGVGLARKILLDEAVSRFNKIHKPRGIMGCFDADATCDKNYLTDLFSAFHNNEKINAASVYFEHPLSGIAFNETVYDGIAQYELHLRYYNQALRYTGFPYAYHTVGSAMAMRASVYCKQGGMNQRKAGEDFYLLQKIIPLGNFTEINTTRVIPSPRISDRVPFGTGASMEKFCRENSGYILTYNFLSFCQLKILFDNYEKFYKNNLRNSEKIVEKLPECLKQFCMDSCIFEKIDEINSHCASQHTFNKRFFNWFNAFKVMKFLNFAREEFHESQKVTEAANLLLQSLNLTSQKTTEDLLKVFRALDKNGSGLEKMIKI